MDTSLGKGRSVTGKLLTHSECTSQHPAPSTPSTTESDCTVFLTVFPLLSTPRPHPCHAVLEILPRFSPGKRRAHTPPPLSSFPSPVMRRRNGWGNRSNWPPTPPGPVNPCANGSCVGGQHLLAINDMQVLFEGLAGVLGMIPMSVLVKPNERHPIVHQLSIFERPQ